MVRDLALPRLVVRPMQPRGVEPEDHPGLELPGLGIDVAFAPDVGLNAGEVLDVGELVERACGEDGGEQDAAVCVPFHGLGDGEWVLLGCVGHYALRLSVWRD